MQIDLIKIGNSHGIRIPQNIIKECGFKDSIEVTLEDHRLILSAPSKPRQNWDNLFSSEMHTEELENKELLAIQNKWDEEEWEW
jgi:antitoxin MazE